MSGSALFLFGVVLVFLIVGANTLVRGAVSVAGRLGVSTLVIGLTVVAFGTSTPEVLISVQAVLSGNDGIAIGNVLGSNVFNVRFILGAAALFAPLAISRRPSRPLLSSTQRCARATQWCSHHSTQRAENLDSI